MNAALIGVSIVVSFWCGAFFALWKVRQLRLRWYRKAQERAKARTPTVALDEGDGDVIIPCGPICQECRYEQYPDWICRLLA